MSFASLEFLFPVPSLPRSRLSPSHSPGVSPQSTRVLQDVLADNHTKWHVFFNDKRFHNHAAHRAIAAWALGANPSTIQSGYEKDCCYEKPAFESPGRINAEKFNEHLGDDKYYNAYMNYFIAYVKNKGISSALEEFVFSRKANLGSNSTRETFPAAKHPLMLSRFLSGILHPMIHTGYGAEFNIPGMIVEGLAQTAVHRCPPDMLSNLYLFDASNSSKMASTISTDIGNAFKSAVAAFDTAVDKVVPETMRADVERFVPPNLESEYKKEEPTHISPQHALSILARVLHKRYPAPSKAQRDENNIFEETCTKHGKEIASYISLWEVNEKNIDEKIEEVIWVVCVLYGVGGWTDKKANGGKFNADFFLMHLVTSSIFLPALCALLSPASQVRLLRAYFNVVLLWAIARGQPPLDIEGFVADTQSPQKSGIVPSLAKDAEHVEHGVEDVWMKMVDAARSHHDEHVTKLIRALAGWAGAFGTRTGKAAVHQSGHSSSEENGHAGVSGLSDVSAASAGLGMGEGNRVYEKEAPEGENELGVSSDSGCRDDYWRYSGAAMGGNDAKMQCMDEGVDLHPRAWRDYKNGNTNSRQPNYDYTRVSDGPRFAMNASETNDKNTIPCTELLGSDYLDGSLFLRAGVLTLNRMGWDSSNEKDQVKENMGGKMGEEAESWDFKGFFKPELKPLKAKN